MGFKMKGFTYPGTSPLKIASVSGAQLVKSVGKTYDKYINYGKILAAPIAKAVTPGHLFGKSSKMSGKATEEMKKAQNGGGGGDSYPGAPSFQKGSTEGLQYVPPPPAQKAGQVDFDPNKRTVQNLSGGSGGGAFSGWGLGGK